LEDGDEETADEAEDEDVPLHDRVVKKYIPAYPRLRSRLYKQILMKRAFSDANFITASRPHATPAGWRLPGD
jgi:hypothetical protein